VDGIGKSVFTLAVSLASVILGIQVSKNIYPYVPKNWASPNIATRYLISVLSILTYPAVIVTYFQLSPSFRAKATASLLFAFPGALCRYILGVHLNPIWPSFPLGTFIVNMAGTIVLAGVRAITGASSSASIRVSPHSCALTQGVGDGFCGCLTTVSTFAVELLTLRRARDRWRYGLVSWILGQVLVVVVYGSVLWTGMAEKGRTCEFE
jgi:fluoride exporter